MCHKGFQRRKELMTSAFEKFTVYQQTKKKKEKKNKKTEMPIGQIQIFLQLH